MRTSIVWLAPCLLSLALLSMVSADGPGLDSSFGHDPFGGGSEEGSSDPFGGGDEFGGGFGFTAVRPAEAPQPGTPPADESPAPTRIWASPAQAASEPIRQMLAKPLTSAGFDFTETPLEEIVEFLQDEYAINIHLDLPALDDLDLRVEEPVSCSFRNLKLGTALELMLNPMELVALPMEGYLLITSEEEADTRLCTAIYPVADLVTQNGRDDIRDVVFSLVATETWADHGGGAADLRITLTGLMIVSQTERVHDQIVSLLEALRKVKPSRLAAPQEVAEIERALGEKSAPRRGGRSPRPGRGASEFGGGRFDGGGFGGEDSF